MFGETITIVLPGGGSTPDREKFTLHKNLLRYQSGRFAMTLPHHREDRYPVNDTTYEVFGAFVSWLYSGQLFDDVEGMLGKGSEIRRNKSLISKGKNKDPQNKPRGPAKRKQLQYMDSFYVEIYAFADRYQIPGLKNAVIDFLIDRWCTSRTNLIDIVGHIYSKTVSKSGLERLAVDMIALAEDDLSSWVVGLQGKDPHPLQGQWKFYDDLLVKRGDNHRHDTCKKSDFPLKFPKCRYHDHRKPMDAEPLTEGY
jgi:hypothetical protein